jgi:hypothetical protein
MPGYVILRIQEQTSADANFARKLNCALRPVIQNTSVGAPDGPASTLFITGIPYAVDCFGQFETTVDAVFRKNDDPGRFRPGLIAEMIDQLLTLNPTLRDYLRERVNAVRQTAMATIPEMDDSFNLAIVTNGSPARPQDLQAMRVGYGRKKLTQYERLYDQLIYPLIFWNGTGGCGVEAGQPFQKATTLMRKSLIALVIQPRGYFLHEMGTLRDEIISALSGRLVNLNIKYLAERGKEVFQEDEIRADEE